jgi:hypothetical protein
LNFVGSTLRERMIEFFLALSGILFYHLVLRPVDYLKCRKREKAQSKNPTNIMTQKNGQQPD